MPPTADDLAGNPQAHLLYGAGQADQAAADAISVQQGRLARALLAQSAAHMADVADRIVNSLALRQAWRPFTANVNDGQSMQTLADVVTGPGQWMVAGVLALGVPTNAASVLITIDGLQRGYPLQFTAPKADPKEAVLNIPLMAADGSFTLTPAGTAGDKATLILRLSRYGVR